MQAKRDETNKQTKKQKESKIQRIIIMGKFDKT